MSESSATTLISPSNARTPSTGGLQRRPSTHSSHAQGHHATKRRGSTHGHGHSARRPSDGEHGRRALVAGLQMHALDTTDALRRQKGKVERPLAKNSRSDTHLPRLSRTHSMTSNTSHSSNNSRTAGRPRRNSHRRSEESVQVLDEQGRATEQVEDEEEGGWEDGELEISPKASKRGKHRKASSTISAAMRRTVSDTSADPTGKSDRRKSTHQQHPSITGVLGDGDLVQTPSSMPHPPALTQRTTGFAGGVQPLDPQLAAQLPTPDPHPIITPHPLRRNTSLKSLVGPVAMEPTQSNASATSHDSGVPTEPSKHEENPSRQRSTEGSGLPQGKENVSTSPSYPFPQMVTNEERSQPEKDGETAPIEAKDTPPSSAPATQPQQQQPPGKSATHPQPRSRQTSSQNGPGPGPHTLRHRYSNSSLRSIQSLRAPPHPLNSSAGYRTASRPGSMIGSPTKTRSERERVPSMHQPPLPKPQVSYEVAQGQGWDAGLPGPDVPRRPVNGTAPASQRKDSVSSVRSLFVGTMTSTVTASPSFSRTESGSNLARNRLPSQTSGQPAMSRRQTALEAASAASKMHVTSDPTLYHHSQGHSSNTAETCFLISRFLPPKKVSRPKWEMDMRDPSVHEELEAGNLKVGLTNGDYRQAHESLVQSIKELGLSNPGTEQSAASELKRGVSSGYSGYSLDPNFYSAQTGSAGYTSAEGLGTVRPKGKETGGLTVARGAFKGKTPFEMSVDRCLAQRPGRVGL